MVRRGLGATIIAQLAAEPIPDDVVVRQLPEPLQRVIGVITLADALQTPASICLFRHPQRDMETETCHYLILVSR